MNSIIKEIESELNIILPSDLREYLNGLAELNNKNHVIWFSDERGMEYDDSVMLFDEVNFKANYQEYYGRLYDKIIPIGSCVGGNVIAYSLFPEKFGVILYCDHDYFDSGCDYPIGSTIIAHSLNKYLNNIK